jgi:hypothetical protein
LPDEAVALAGDLLWPHGEDEASPALVGLLHFKRWEILLEEGLRLGKARRRGELDLDLAVAPALRLLDGDTLGFEGRPHALGRPIGLDLERLVDVHPEYEVDPAWRSRPRLIVFLGG